MLSVGQFLRLVWPAEGHYCIAHPFKPEGSTNTVYAHKVFATISEAVTHCLEQEHVQDVFFSVLPLREARLWDATKKDYKTGQPGAWTVRTQENMLSSKCSFFDLDVGSEAGKYPTQADALQGLIDFCTKAGLPLPTLVSSGRGVHVYWHYDAAVPAAEWRTIAWHMRQLAEALGLKVDPTRTIDTTSVLRVPNTFNWKDRQNPRRVQVMQVGAITPVPVFHQMVKDALVRAGVVPTDAPARRAPTAAAANPLGESNVDNIRDFGPPPTVAELGAVCGQVRQIIRSQVDKTDPFYGPLDNTAWYRGMLATLKHAEGGEDLCRQLTDLHPRSVSDIEAKLHQLEAFPPAKCETLQQNMPWRDTPCQGCQFRDKVANPFMACRKGTVAPPPSLTETSPAPSGAGSSPGPSSAPPPSLQMATLVAPSAPLLAATIPNPPLPWKRLKTGQLAIERTDKDGNVETREFFDYDLYPLRRLSNKADEHEQQVWRVALPRTGYREFVLDADALYDSRKFTTAIANNGLYPNKADISLLQDYMVAYISQLQKTSDAEDQVTHLGWTDEYKRFVLPDKTLLADGSVKNSSLSKQAASSTSAIAKKGTLAKQVELLRFYRDPAYAPNQVVVLGGLGSIIFHMTGHHGVVVNCSGDAGASKSTTLYTAASLWGDSKMWPINGTNRGATANGRMHRVKVNANLPTCVDEITHIPPREAIDLVMSITQPGDRVRLDQTGAERSSGSEYKSAIMIATANSSLHSLLSTDNAAGTAGSMRVFEMRFTALSIHTKAEADEYLRQLNENYGHIGEVFAAFVVRNYDAVRARVHRVMEEIDAAGRISSAERFWSAYIAVVLVSGEIARALGLLDYDVTHLREWILTKQLPAMRGTVKEEYRDPLAILTDYIAERSGNIIVVNRLGGLGGNTAGHNAAGALYAESVHHGALLGHYDKTTGVLYLLKQPFKEYCARVGSSSARVLEDLSTPRSAGAAGTPTKIVVDKQVRRTLGAGTDHAKGQSWCFAVDMNHAEISGQVQLGTVTGGTPTSAPAGQLKAVT